MTLKREHTINTKAKSGFLQNFQWNEKLLDLEGQKAMPFQRDQGSKDNEMGKEKNVQK